MTGTEKHCDTCRHSYWQRDKNAYIPDGVLTQHCSNEEYNSPNYTHEMLMEDWDKGYCRYWTPKTQKGQ